MSPADSPDRDEDLAELLADLETTLSELRGELRTGDDGRGSRPDRRNDPDGRRRSIDRNQGEAGLPRPPSVPELFRFTEQYTLPTLIATLEATIRALELLRGALRLLDGRSVSESGDRRGRSSAARLGDGVAGVGRGAVSGVERALSELEAALSETDIPEDRAGDDLLAEARELSAEIADRLDSAQADGRDRYAESTRDAPDNDGAATGSRVDPDGVTIEVTGEGDPAEGTNGNGDGTEDPPAVDVDAELESIRDELRGSEGAGDPEDDASDGPGSTADETSSSEEPTTGHTSGSEEPTEADDGTDGRGADGEGSGT
jgi:hypothetical protein